jgi:hypothetical protein
MLGFKIVMSVCSVAWYNDVVSLNAANKPFKDGAQTALFKGPVRTAL